VQILELPTLRSLIQNSSKELMANYQLTGLPPILFYITTFRGPCRQHPVSPVAAKTCLPIRCIETGCITPLFITQQRLYTLQVQLSRCLFRVPCLATGLYTIIQTTQLFKHTAAPCPTISLSYHGKWYIRIRSNSIITVYNSVTPCRLTHIHRYLSSSSGNEENIGPNTSPNKKHFAT
jgi:hypothetical protein